MIYDLYHLFAGTISGELKCLGILNEFKSRGAFAAYWDAIHTDLRSVASSAGNAELIPDEEILESQFPEVLRSCAITKSGGTNWKPCSKK